MKYLYLDGSGDEITCYVTTMTPSDVQAYLDIGVVVIPQFNVVHTNGISK